MRNAVLDDLRNAAASGTLLVITGAGISQGLRRADGNALPNWGQLVQALRAKADGDKLSSDNKRLLDDLLPEKALDKVHGDALIEATELLYAGFAKGKLEEAIAELCREQDGTFTDTHLAIAQIAPVGVITFNYDQGHEVAFRTEGSPAQSIRYDESDKLKACLAGDGSGSPFVLKAHGCISYPSSLVLTSSSYHAVLSKNRAYRLFLQHSLARYTVLVVGFALRDRDFDQLLGTLEIELGRPYQTHAFITKGPDTTTTEGLVKRADWAAVTARFGLQPLYVDKFEEIPQLLRSIGAEAGSLIDRLVGDSGSSDGPTRRSAHERAIGLGKIGRAQMRSALLNRLDRPDLDLGTRSELIYAFRGIVDDDARVALRLAAELQLAADRASDPDGRLHAECAAHALVVLRGIRIKNPPDLQATLKVLRDTDLLSKLHSLDKLTDVPRLKSYALAAAAEIESRNRALS
jgi:hypothetical protein